MPGVRARTGRRIGVSLLTLLYFSLHGHLAAADDASPVYAAAVASFEEGTRLVTQGDCPAAILKFKESLATEPGVGAGMDLADCEERTGSLDAAWRDFRRAERLAVARHDDRAFQLHERTLRVQRQLEVLVLPRVVGLTLAVDGAAVDPDLYDDGSTAVVPGAHRVSATAPGYEPLVLDLPGDREPGRVVTVPPLARTPPPPPPRPAPQPSGSPQRVFGLALGGLGLLGIGTGAVAGAVTLASRHDAAAACGASYPHCALSTQGAVLASNNEAEVAGTMSTTAFLVGGAALAGGAILFLTAPRAAGAESAPSPSPPEPPRATVRVAPVVGAGTTGLALSGSF